MSTGINQRFENEEVQFDDQHIAIDFKDEGFGSNYASQNETPRSMAPVAKKEPIVGNNKKSTQGGISHKRSVSDGIFNNMIPQNKLGQINHQQIPLKTKKGIKMRQDYVGSHMIIEESKQENTHNTE